MQSIDIFPWDDNFNTGIDRIDEQHRKLVQLLNQLASHVAFRSDVPELNGIIDALTDYTVYHFRTEEAIWAEFLPGDPAESGHKLMHQGFVETVLRLKNEQGSKPIGQIAEEALGFLARWLASHILESDRYLAYVVLAMQSGMTPEAAKQRASEQMSGSTRVLIDIILSIYETLSSNTLQLMRELADRKGREEALNEARIRAEAANVAKSRFLANISHEIRTPLNDILGMAQLLKEPKVTAPERLEYAQTILDSGRSLLALLNAVLDLSRVESGKIQLELAVLELRQLVEEIRLQFSAAAADKGLQFITEVDAGIPDDLCADPQRIQQMVSILLGNALKFTQAGKVSLAVREIGRDQDGVVLEFSVADTGIGIAREKQPMLFQPFSQVDDSYARQYDGAGLGLAILRSLVQYMGGEAGVESEPGAGSRFWFRIRAGQSPQ